MKHILLIGVIAISIFGANAQNKKLQHDPTPTVRRMMDKYHCEPPKTEDALIHRIISNLVKTLDPNRLYFTKPDADTIYDSADMLKEELKGRETRFANKVMLMYRIRLETADSTVSIYMRKVPDYSQKEYATIKDTVRATSAIDLKKRWENDLKYDCLHQLAGIALADSSATPSSAMKQEPQIREKVRKSMLRKIRRPLTYPAGYDAYIMEQLSDAICKAYDPHSDYFTKSAKENFDGAVTGESDIFGFDIEENEHEEVCIIHLLPGSPAWRSGELNKGDVIISLRWAGQNAMEMLGADVEDVSRFLDDRTHKDLEIGVRKADGTQKLVWLERQKIQIEEHFVKSYVLDAGDTKVGYIVLPGFYAESESKNGKSCANDVAREVVKLKQENIQSIILDLRNNGGGSMSEAMQLAGIFIDEGILAFAKYNTGKPAGFRDPNRGTIYDGPLIVMVNKASASASEMVAGALQDYNRALIVGSPTFGKATMQVVLPNDTTVEPEKYPGYSHTATEFLKITIGRFYRVTGSTHQLTGVQPDIHLPDLTEAAGYGESHLRYPLHPDTVKRATYFKPLSPLPIEELSAKSNQRVSTSDAFKMIERYADFVKRSRKASQGIIPLKYDEYLAFTKQFRTESKTLVKEYESIHKPGVYKTKNPAADSDKIKPDHALADEQKKTIENIDKDIYIQECFSILTNYLKPTKK